MGQAIRVADYQWFDVTSFGARGGDVETYKTVNRTATQRAINALKAAGGKGIIYVPDLFVVDRSGSNCIDFSGCTDVTFKTGGLGCGFKLAAANYVGDVHILQCKTGNTTTITIEDMTFDGNYDNCTFDSEQFHGLYIGGVTGAVNNVWVSHCEFRDTRGDGIFIVGSVGDDPSYTVKNLWIENCNFYDNHRSGIACQRGLSWFWFRNNKFTRIDDQSIDMEATGAGSATDGNIIGNKIYHNNFTEALAFAPGGVSTSDRMKRMKIKDNEIYGGSVLVGHVEDVDWINNTIYGQTNARALDIRDAVDFRMRGGHYEGNLTGEAVINISRVGGSIIDVSVKEATIIQNQSTGGGIVVDAFDRGVHLDRNQMVGAGANVGIYVSIAEANDTITRYDFSADGNDIRNFADEIILRSPNVATKLNTASICHNLGWDSQTVPTQVDGVNFDSNGSGTFIENQSFMFHGNTWGRGTVRPIVDIAWVLPYCIGGNASNLGVAGAPSQWVCSGSPEGAITACVGSKAYRIDGGAGTSEYTKESTTGNTGWVGK